MSLAPSRSSRPARRLVTRSLIAGSALWALATGAAAADPAPFDLQGPSLDVTVTHGGATLPIAEVPNLAPGDRLSVKADLPADSSVRYLLVVAFLRGATDPPPRGWFFKTETQGKGSGPLEIAVPAGSKQAVVLLAPKTGGDFAALVGAVRSRPGVFVRASQDLNQASQDRVRLDAYLAGLHAADRGDPDALKTVAPLLARSLVIKLNDACFQKMPELQAACLTEGREALVLGDPETDSLVGALTSGASADLAVQIGDSPQARFGYYSSYVGAAMDIVRILNSFRTAHFQYIPALATAKDDRLNLFLNSPPSFQSPKSVLVAALPMIEPPQPPTLRVVDPGQPYCAYRPDLVLPVEGGPLVYATRYAHDLVLRIKLPNGHDVDVAARADAEKGGFVVDTSALTPATFGQGTEGVIHGQWGFTPFDGPQVSLRGDHAQGWTLSDEARRSLVVGRSDPLTLTGDAACVDKVAVSTPEGRTSDVAWRLSGPDKLSLTLPLTKAEPGGLSLSIWRYGAAAPQIVPLRAYAPASEIAAFAFAAGDQAGVLKGSRLDEVAELRLAGVAFKPSESQPTPGELTMLAVSPDAAAALAAGRTLTADIDLKDGRREQLAVKVSPPRPTVALIAKSVRRPLATDGLIIRLGDDRELAQDGVLAFSFRALRPAALAADVSVEVATADGRGSVTLTPKDGVTLEDAGVGVVTLDLAKAFDTSVFGPLRFRVVEDGTASNWQPLGTLVRLPILKTLACRKARRAGCELAGDRLFLLESVSADAAFAQPAVVQPGFAGDTLVVPHPDAGRLYARLRDAPDIVNAVDIFEPGQDVALARRTPPASTAGPN